MEVTMKFTTKSIFIVLLLICFAIIKNVQILWAIENHQAILTKNLSKVANTSQRNTKIKKNNFPRNKKNNLIREAGEWETIMSEDFELVFPGWNDWALYYSEEGNSSTWNDVLYDPATCAYDRWCGWCAGSDYSPPENYQNNMYAWMVYGPFSLSDAFDAVLNFSVWYKIETDQDYFRCCASIDDYHYYGPLFSGESSGWEDKVFDLKTVPYLGNLCGQSQVYIAFMFYSDDENTDAGVYIDDIELIKNTSAPTGIDLEVVDFGPSNTQEPFSVGDGMMGWEITVKNNSDNNISGVNIGIHCRLDQKPPNPSENLPELLGGKCSYDFYAGETRIFNYYCNYYPFPGDPVYFYAYVDPENDFAEDDEDNNIAGPKSYEVAGDKVKIRADIQFYKYYDEKIMPLIFTIVKIFDYSTNEELGSTCTDAVGKLKSCYVDNRDDLSIKVFAQTKKDESLIVSTYLTQLNIDLESIHINEPDNYVKGYFNHITFQEEDKNFDILLQGLQISNMIYDEWAWIKDNGNGWYRDQIDVVYDPNNVGNSGFSKDYDIILISGRPDHFYIAPLHEYGHAVMYSLYNGNVTWGDAVPDHHHYTVSNPEFAWVEGWAEFMNCIVYNDKTWQSAYSTHPHAGSDMEDNYWYQGADYTNTQGELVEGAVASVLWDMQDSNYDGFDETNGSMSGQFSNILNILLNSDPKPKNICEFFAKWGDDNLLEGIAYGHGTCYNYYIDIPSSGNYNLPQNYNVSLNYPNPFNPATSIKYQLPEDGEVIIRVFNMLGKYITTLEKSRKQAGFYSVKWDGCNYSGENVSSGVYLIEFKMNNFYKTIKTSLIK